MSIKAGEVHYAQLRKIEVNKPLGSGFIYIKGQEQAACDTLLAANNHSVNQRYGERNDPPHYTFTPTYKVLTHIEAIKACDCLAYQCDEWLTFEASNAQRLLDAIRTHATRHLPGYDEAAWCIE